MKGGLTDENSAKVRELLKKIQIDYFVGTGSGSGGVFGVLVWQGHPMSEEFETNIGKLLAGSK